MKKLLFVLLSVFTLGLMVSCNPDVPAEKDSEDTRVYGAWEQNCKGLQLYYTLTENSEVINGGDILIEADFSKIIPTEGKYIITGTFTTSKINKTISIKLTSGEKTALGETTSLTESDIQKLLNFIGFTDSMTYEFDNEILTITTTAETPEIYYLIKNKFAGTWEKTAFSSVTSLSSAFFSNTVFTLNNNRTTKLTTTYTSDSKSKEIEATGTWTYTEGKLTVAFDKVMVNGADDSANMVSFLKPMFGIDAKPCVILDNTFILSDEDHPTMMYTNVNKKFTELEDTSMLNGKWESWFYVPSTYVYEYFDFSGSEVTRYNQLVDTTYKGSWTYSKPTLSMTYNKALRNKEDEDWIEWSESTTRNVTTNGDILVFEYNSEGSVSYRYLIKE